MMQKSLVRWAATALMSAALAACGGGDGEPAAAAVAVAQVQPRDAAAGAVQALAGTSRKQRLAVTPANTVLDAHESARQLMDFAQAQFPGYFPAHAATTDFAPFVFRHYAATDTYLGVVVAAGTSYVLGGVYVMGGAFGNQPQYVGQITDFIVPTAPGFTATLASDKAQVVQGSSTHVRVNLQRLHGFTGVVQLTLTGLPAGATAPAVTIAAGATFADIPLAAQGSAPHSLPTAATLRASAVIDSRTLLAHEAITVTVRGAPGALDTSFGGGVQITPVASSEDYAHAWPCRATAR